jgi:hypothetical protein
MKTVFTKEGLEKQKALIGEFIILFESLNDTMRFILPKIIFPKHITELQSKNIETLMTDLGAEQLKSKFESLIFDNFYSFPQFTKTNSRLSIKTSELAGIRNSIAHGSYRLGWHNFNGELSDNSFSLRHSKSTKNGYQKRSKIISTDELIELNKTLHEISSCYTLIQSIILLINVENRIDLAESYITSFIKKVDELEKISLKHLDILN